MQFGSKVNGTLKPRYIEEASASLSDAGGVYQVDIETEGIPDEEVVITQLLQLENEVEDFKVLWIKTDPASGVITMQFMDTGPNPFSFVALLAAMPILLGLVFIAVLAFVFWDVFVSNPILLYGVVVLGAAVAFFYLTSGKISAPTKDIYTPKGTIRTPVGIYQEEQKNQRQQINIEHDKIIDKLQQQITELQKEKKEGTIQAETAENKIEKLKEKTATEKKELKNEIARAEKEATEKNKELRQNVRG